MVSILLAVGHAFRYEWHRQGYWMGVNFLLAVAPAIGGFVLYHWWRHLYGLRWILLLAVCLLLPNSPYVVTDLIHLRWMLDRAPTPLDRFAVVGLLAFLIAGGVVSYAYTVHLARRTMRRWDWPRRRRMFVEIGIDGVCAVGVALGRISRLNSWDAFRPEHMLHGLGVLAADPKAVVLAGIIVVLADLPVDRLASGAAHRLQSRFHHH